MASHRRLWPTLIAACVSVVLAATAARATPTLVLDVDSGDVLYQEMPTAPWYPASLTKLMTAYVALSAVREGRITLDTPLMVSPRAAVMPPSKMGFRPGTLVTLDNALKMLMVKSPNDVAITVAEGVSGSVEAFANEMNAYGARLGLRESHFVNPNGLPDGRHISSARDMALIGRALLRDFPEERPLFGIGLLSFGRQLIHNHNGMLGRYPGVDGMKTGFTCAAGFNVVESAERNGRHLIVVVLGSPSTRERNQKAAALFDRYFAESGSSVGKLDSLPEAGGTPPDMHDVACRRNRHPAIVEAEAEDAPIPAYGTGKAALDHPELTFLFNRPGMGSLFQTAPAASSMSQARAEFEPVRVFIGPVPGWTGRIAQAIGAGSKELTPSPVKTRSADAVRKPVDQARGPAQTPPTGATENPSPGPLALLGATQLLPATLATRRLVRAAPSLSLNVGPGRKGRLKAKLPQVATAKPQVLAAAAPAAPAKPKPHAMAKKVAAKPAAVKRVDHPAAARRKLAVKPGTKPTASAQP